MVDTAKLTKELSKEKIKSVIIHQNDETVFEYYKNNKQRDKLHPINSCTKSIMSILIGIAIDKKYLDSIDLPVHLFFPKLFKEQADQRKMELTIYHLLSMTDGLDFPEFGEWNCFAPMIYHSDIVKFVIDRPLIHTPGTHMNYNSGCSHILSAILQQVTKMKTEDFAKEYLFKPLGITEYRWYADKMKINKGADGLVLKTEDMLKIGQLMLNNGEYKGKRIISAEWLKQTTTPILKTYDSIGYYGLHWWVNQLDKEQDFSADNLFYFALGFGGQYIIVLPSKKMVIAVTSELYPESLKPLRILSDFIV